MASALNRLRLVTFEHLQGPLGRRLGIHHGGQVVDLAREPSLAGVDARAFLAGGPSLLSKAAKIVESGQHRIPEGSVKFKAPIYNPEKVVCVG